VWKFPPVELGYLRIGIDVCMTLPKSSPGLKSIGKRKLHGFSPRLQVKDDIKMI
jgi:hypothetical protein